MVTRGYLILGAAFVLGTVFVGVVSLRPSPRKTQAPSSEPRQLDEARDTPRHVVVHEHKVIPAAVATDAAPDRPSARVDEEPAEMTQEEVHAHFEATYPSDAPAGVESKRMEATVRKGFDEASGLGGQIRSLDCRATRCRAEIKFDNAMADNRVFKKVFRESDTIPYAWTVPSRVVGADGSVVATMYFYPQGASPY
jgi:hypothetical protein